MQTLFISAIVTFVACYPVLLLLRRTGRLDVPNIRSSHAVPTPRGGGLALLAGAAAAALAALVSGPSWTMGTWAAVAGCAALALVGLADDTVGLPPQQRLVAQAVIGAATGGALAGWVGAALGAVIIPAAVNMVNFMDGINGLSAAHAAVWGVGAMVAARAGASGTLAVLGAIALGCALGFLPWNAPRARLFLGDVGSYFFGALAGVGLVVCMPTTEPKSGLLPLALVCAPYLLFALDTSTTIVRRLAAGEQLFTAHRTHIYQRLTNDRGLPHWVVSSSVAAVSFMITAMLFTVPAAAMVMAVASSFAYLVSPKVYLRGRT